MPHSRYTTAEIVRRGEEMYRRDIRPEVETSNRGKFLALDIDSGDYEIDTEELGALDRLKAKHPDGAYYILRIGYAAAARVRILLTMSKLRGSECRRSLQHCG